MVEQMMIALLCGGHALLEGVPGTAKTLSVRVLARVLSCDWKRIQFTPDLMPSDIIGTNVFDMSNNSFSLRRGPIFTDLLLADEINRAPAKTQSALLEGMSESHATIDGTRHQLSEVFTVFATQNPIEFEGTYPLPEAQQDRFLLKIKIDYPGEEAELRILQAYDAGTPLDRPESGELRPVIDVKQLIAARVALAKVRVEPSVLHYILTIARETRNHDAVLVGASPRGSISLLLASKGRTLLHGRDFVTPDDVVAIVEPVLGHRITLAADAEISGTTTSEVLQSILDKTEVPR
ncbi:MAG: MoxR family ATPase [Planctomycetes bacterium]|nr:MoxR family ATPase [Planctomycetota bacterium]